MGNVRQVERLRPALRLGATAAALAVITVLVLMVGTVKAAQAQDLQVIYTFTGFRDGAQPYSGLTLRSGSLYGTTHSGNEGANWGNVYQLKFHGGWIYSALNLFDGTLESRPTFGPDGILYGTSPNNIAGLIYGYVYNLRPAVGAVCHSVTCSWNTTVLYAFGGGGDGASPRYGELVFDEAGHMYGTTMLGGQNGFGTVYELSPNGGGWTERVLYSFQGTTDGTTPTAGLFLDAAGNLYGSTMNGGSGGAGTIFELSPNGSNWNYSLLYSFSGNVNCGPGGTLTMDASGSLYGTSFCAGANNLGNIFKLAPSGGGGWTYSSIHDFTGGNDGSKPFCNVTFDTAGNMFGTASAGGSMHSGTVWEIPAQ